MTDTAKGKAVICGAVEIVEQDGENYKHQTALVIVFDSPEQCRKALIDGVCKFTFGEPPTTEGE